MAASQPAWPPPTTITSKDSVGAAEKLMSPLSIAVPEARVEWVAAQCDWSSGQISVVGVRTLKSVAWLMANRFARL